MCNPTRLWLVGPLLALAILGGAVALALYAQSPSPRNLPALTVEPTAGSGGPSSAKSAGKDDVLRFSRDVAGDAKPIVIDANEIHTWNDNGKVVVLLKGQVLVQQSVVQARFEQGVAWIDLQRYQATGILHLDLYAEGQVRLDTTLQGQEGKRAVLDLNTRGEFRLRAHRGKVLRQDRSTDPLIGRANVLGIGSRVIQASAPAQATPTSAVQVGTPLVPAPVVQPAPKRPIFEQPKPGVPLEDPPVPTPNVVPASKQGSAQPPAMIGGGLRPVSFLQVPGQKGSASSEYVLTQGTGANPPSPAPGAKPVPGPDGSILPSRPYKLPPPPGSNESPMPLPPDLPPVPPPSESRRQPGGNNNPEPPGPASPGPESPVPPPPPQPEPLPSPAPEAPGQGGNAPVVPLPPPSQPAGPPAPPPLPANSLPRQYRILPRSGENFDVKVDTLPDGTRVIMVTKGVILNIKNVPRVGNLDVEADRAVIWTRGGDLDGTARNLRSPQGEKSTELEFYMAGHVTMRVQAPNFKEKSVLETDELYYDTNRNVAVALNARMQVMTTRTPRGVSVNEPLYLTTPQLLQTSETTFEAVNAEVFSSKLSSDPGLKLVVSRANLEERKRLRTNIIGMPIIDRKTGLQKEVPESILECRNVIAKLEGVPFFYTPYLITDARDPLGPLETIHVGGNRVFGFQAGLGLNVYKLLGIDPIEGTRGRFNADYLSRRGVGIGTTFNYLGNLFDVDPFNLDDCPGNYLGELKLYGIHDDGTDILGAQPANLFTFNPPGYRGRATWVQQVTDLPYGFNIFSQTSLLSDRNFLEEYYKREFDTGFNQANVLYVKQQQDQWAWSALGQARTSAWITTTEWLPRADGYLIGQDLFGWLTSNTQLSAGYARLRPSNDPDNPIQGIPPPPIPGSFVDPTTREIETARLALLQELSLPLTAGPFKIVPYVKGALVGYSDTLQGQQIGPNLPTDSELGRIWGGGGTRISIPFTRLYPDVCSELFNVNGINHKIVLSANYFIARSNEPYQKFPQLDRLNDDATTQAVRELRPYEPNFNSYGGLALATSPLFDPQRYAIRRLIDNRIDTLDEIQVLQVDARQRLQTKRGFPGAEHIVDWMVLETSFSYFPEADTDNFGKPFSFIEYNYLWNIGDRTAFESTGWYDPQDKGPRVYTVGLHFNRTDRTSFFLGYRQIDPLQSRMVTGSVAYTFSPKYSMSLSASYDFGTQESVSNTLTFTRTGTDLQVTLGFSYNSLQNNFNAIVEIVPSLLPLSRRASLMTGQPGGPFAR